MKWITFEGDIDVVWWLWVLIGVAIGWNLAVYVFGAKGDEDDD